MAWTRVGSVTVRPETKEAVIGVIDVPPQGGVELMIRQVNPAQGFRFAYGLVSLLTPRGRELGTVKAWTGPEWSAFRLGEGLSCLAGGGQLVFEPRAINLRWIKAGFPWEVEFMADVGYQLPADRHLAPGFQDPINRVLQLVRVGSQGRVRF
jgi:hypothetical protein